jgi:hypothetical protein
MHDLVELVSHAMSESLGDRLESIYLFGSLAEGFFQAGESDVNLLLLVADGTGLHEVRSAFLPLWREHGAALGRAPLVAERRVLKRHLALHPLLGAHLSEHAQRLFGQDELPSEPVTPDPREHYARTSYEAMEASAAVAPQMLSESVAASRLAQLRRLGRRIAKQPIPEDVPPTEILADIQSSLRTWMEESTSIERWVSGTRPTTSLLLPGLESSYKELGHIILSFGTISREQITGADWQLLSVQLKKHYAGLKLVTSTQLRLVAEWVTPLAMALQRYQHEWGIGVLDSVELLNSRVLGQAARAPSELLVQALPSAYLVSEDEEMGKLIHDFQNRILNIHLEHELLGRLQKVEQYPAPEVQFDREAPHELRIRAIVGHLNSWVAYYMDHAPDDA